MSDNSVSKFHIVTWNVNGIRAWLKKGAFDWIRFVGADVVCLQEIKARPEQLARLHNKLLEDYCAYWNPADRPGYSGVLTLSKNEPDQVAYGLDVEHFDVEGRVIATQHSGIHLFNVYFPNGRRDLSRVDYKLDFYRIMLERCDELHARNEQIVITGDFNTAHRSIDLKNPTQNAGNTGFLPEERAWIDRFLEHGFVDVYRQFYPDREQYTWWTYRSGARKRNVGWRLDYFLVSDNLIDRVEEVVIHDQVTGSDHCPVSLYLRG
jgi:exodeoxyribonuclease-3